MLTDRNGRHIHEGDKVRVHAPQHNCYIRGYVSFIACDVSREEEDEHVIVLIGSRYLAQSYPTREAEVVEMADIVEDNCES